MDLHNLINEIEIQLDQLSDPKRLGWANKNYPTSMTVKGVTVPNIRPIAKDLTKRLKKFSPEKVIEFANMFLQSMY